MNFKEYVAYVKAAHHQEPEKIIAEFKDHFKLMETEADVMIMTDLIVHVCGQMGEWEKGIALLRKIKNNATISNKAAMNRNVAILDLGNNPNLSLENFSTSDQVIINASVAAALAGLGGMKNAEKLFTKASTLSETLPKEDPGIKTLGGLAVYIAKGLNAKADKNEVEAVFLSKALEVVKRITNL